MNRRQLIKIISACDYAILVQLSLIASDCLRSNPYDQCNVIQSSCLPVDYRQIAKSKSLSGFFFILKNYRTRLLSKVVGWIRYVIMIFREVIKKSLVWVYGRHGSCRKLLESSIGILETSTEILGWNRTILESSTNSL